MDCSGEASLKMCTQVAEEAHGLHGVTSYSAGCHGYVRTTKAGMHLPPAGGYVSNRIKAR